MPNCKPITCPMFASQKFSAFDSTFMDDLTLYRSTVESLQYHLVIRLDLSFAMNPVCQFVHASCVTH